MSHLKAEALLREFHYDGIRIPDPGPELTVEKVRDLLAETRPNFPRSPRRRYPAPKRQAQSCATRSAGRSAPRAE